METKYFSTFTKGWEASPEARSAYRIRPFFSVVYVFISSSPILHLWCIDAATGLEGECLHIKGFEIGMAIVTEM
jgi:hypothetical protein